MKIKFLLFVTLFVACVSNYAQSVDDVTLVVNGSGATKEDAVHTALRGAIEQAFGVFVSANTSIVNDELVKDEIATVTSGNVKSFTELESVALPNGNFAVTLQAVVSTQKLVAYAKSKGSSCEFAGATFGANLKLMELNQINTEKAFENLMVQLESLVPYIFDYSIELGQPAQMHPSQLKYSYYDGYTCNINNAEVLGNVSEKNVEEFGTLPVTLKINSNENTMIFVRLLKNTINALALNAQQISEMKALGRSTFGFALAEMDNYYASTAEFDLPWWPGKYVYRNKSTAGVLPFVRHIEFYSAFPAQKLNTMIEDARSSYIVKSNIGDVFTFETQKEKCKDVQADITMIKSNYGARLYAGCNSCLVVPKWPKPKKKSTSVPTIELNKIEATLVMPIEKLKKISNFEVVKNNE